jgi:acylphosphatase
VTRARVTQAKDKLIARKYRVQGRVQGVGFRYFVKQNADALGIRGYVRNEDDGSVFVYAAGSPLAIEQFAGAVRTGPRFSEVRTVEEKEAGLEKFNSFVIEA